LAGDAFNSFNPRSLDPCDRRHEVIARGTLAHVAGGEGDYREAAGGWVLRGGIDVIATRPAVRPSALHAMRFACYLVLFGSVGYCGLWAVGHTLVSRFSWSEASRSETPLTELLSSLVLASALPHSRADALDQLDATLHYGFAHSEHTDRMLVALAAVRDGCAGEAAAELEQEHFEDALATAQMCGAKTQQVQALVYLGRYDEAAALHPEGYDQVPDLVAIATGHWADAAAAEHEELAWLREDPALSDPSLEERAACLELWFRGKAGDGAAAKQLADEAGMGNVTCNIAHALTLPAEQRTAALGDAAKAGRDNLLNGWQLADVLAWSYSEPDTADANLALTNDVLFENVDGYPWLAAVVPAINPYDPIALARRAVWEAIVGNFAGAREAIARAMTSADGFFALYLKHIAQAIDLHTSEHIARDDHYTSLERLIELRRRDGSWR
jgi:hypothetical protein